MEHIHVLIGLGAVMSLVLVLPFTVRRIEEELEAFLLVMGTAAVTISGLWSRHLIGEALTEPLKITAAVFVFGIIFRLTRAAIHDHVNQWVRRLGPAGFVFALVVGLGLLSSVITAIMAALTLAEIISGLQWDKDRERRVVILSCYSIGLGAALTPIGEPLSTIATAKLSGEPHHAGFFFLFRMLWPWVIGGILSLGVMAVWAVRRAGSSSESGLEEDRPETWVDVLSRTAKVYVFVAALVLLGSGFQPFADRYLIEMPKSALYWVNSVSAVLDNATLAAAEISPKMSLARIEFLLMGLLIAGGMLIPGNIPNIICAAKLDIKSGAWARFAAPIGLALMTIYFILMLALIRSE
ncbi:MAG: hypothetical protein A3G34_02880 [Candidatus Lindowbacteria bacterium RIFCSPLOWO2_12_FULL_62_27]|nr:MAG: hypothetical protein A3G34_02880 [Candidatus Lindowbacteria bacterium RIFCSPLOWO2_12_FULL_62_27]OGH64034.1 MAG: hypothetical protein A3I06_01650 [Candidatus Lindowbacteria bacterium RIFCSPLOWO2_02_FULL_62_12]